MAPRLHCIFLNGYLNDFQGSLETLPPEIIFIEIEVEIYVYVISKRKFKVFFFNKLNVVYILAASTLSINCTVQSNESFNFRFEQALNLISISLVQRKPVLYLTVDKNQKPDTKNQFSCNRNRIVKMHARISPNLNHPLFLSVARNKPLSLSLVL